MTENNQSAFYTAFLAAQKEMRDPVKDGSNPHFRSRFVTLKGVLDAVREPLHKHGITLSQALDFDANGAFVVTTLAHTSGQCITSRCPVICAKPNDPQAFGSATTYARRYGAAAICCVAPSDDDDDGEAAAASTRQAPKPKAATPVYTNPSERGLAEAAKRTPGPVVVSELADPFDLAEHAVAAINDSLTEADLNATAARIKASKFTGEDLKTVQNAWRERQRLPVRSV